MKKCFLLALSLCFATIVNAQLSGTYTINSNSSQNPDYTSLSAAASALSAGVSGQVIFEVAPGTYEEYVTVNQINGASATNRVIFRGMGADNQQVVITSNAGYTDKSTLKLSGADYVTFETYPASQTVNLNNTFNDPDDPNENIVITVASNSNPSVVSATINNKILTVTRLVSTGGVATITLNAESAGQSVQTSLNQSGLSAQYTAATGAGYDGTTQYGVAYCMGVQTDVYASDGQAHTVTGCYVTNNLWAYQNMHDGDAPLPPTPPQDLPPYVVNPVDDVVFNEYPETITINLDGVVTDDDDSDENIVYSIVSNSNENELQAVINNKVLTLTRLSREESTATLVIRATSDDQYVEFDVNIIINFVPEGVYFVAVIAENQKFVKRIVIK